MTKYRSFTSFVQSIFYYGKDDSKGLNKYWTNEVTKRRFYTFSHAVVARGHETLAGRRLTKRKCKPTY